ncbi:MAG: NAD(P)H-hydrate dehydratase [Acidimicrobiia bacterium]
MIPVVTPEEMRAIDAAAPEPVEVLIERAGAATFRAALRVLGGRAYGRRVLVVAGKGNNGNDGRSAARRLARRGVQVAVVAPGQRPPSLAGCDLVIDAAFGTGLRGGWRPPDVGGVPVLAVDIPSGVDGLTGAVPEGALAAAATVTFAALKPGLLLAPGRWLAGPVEVADIGLDCRRARAWLVGPADVAAWVPDRAVDAHKWRAAVWVLAGSPSMPGASHLAVRAALRAGAGYVRLSSPGLDRSPGAPTEAVYHPLPAHGRGWAAAAAADADRFGAAVLGPGLGRSEAGDEEIRSAVQALPVPLVVDGDGLSALGGSAAAVLARRRAATVLTPHDGEFERLSGSRPGQDRFDDVRRLAAASGAVVLLKGPTTLVADPAGRVGVCTAGDARLATAGSGDVLSGVIGALLAQGLDPWRAALAGAEVHGQAGARGPARGLVAGDLVDQLPEVWRRLAAAGGRHAGWDGR